MMKIYLAATFRNQDRMRKMRDKLFLRGHSVISTWLNEQIKPEGMSEVQFGAKMAAKDLREVQEADCLILDLADPSKTGGKLIEYGFALAHHKLLYVVLSGEPLTPGHIFLHMADCVFETWDDLLGCFDEDHITDEDPKKYITESEKVALNVVQK